MALRLVLLFTSVLLFSGVHLHAVTENWWNSNDTLNQIPLDEQKVASEGPGFLQTGPSEPYGGPPLDDRLSLGEQTAFRHPEAQGLMGTFQNPLGSETAGDVAPEPPRPTARGQSAPAPDPPVEQKPKVASGVFYLCGSAAGFRSPHLLTVV